MTIKGMNIVEVHKCYDSIYDIFLSSMEFPAIDNLSNIQRIFVAK